MAESIKETNEQKTGRLTAKEAKELSNKNKISLDEILDCIKNTAESGFNYYMIDNISQDTILELIKLGYSCRMDENIVNAYTITWL